ncbi:OLC1v1018877C1 [Oldenlandia corymbosa var. corymbosa]|uniref:OLC1v1018877C1 n=1 Tax=Oldenlandia corymbosa var. corymbosa TaxID=529605 RepID=A0AAV1ECM3_OLDCO|nr:OLC1v1018877C1 [Oldenlandia corymbosa var. corymbosa]
MTANHPEYTCLAARFAVLNLNKNTQKPFSETVKDLYSHVNERSGLKAPLIADDVYEIIMKQASRLDSELIYDRDFDYNYFGFKTLEFPPIATLIFGRSRNPVQGDKRWVELWPKISGFWS